MPAPPARAVSAPTALIGGLLSLLLAGAMLAAQTADRGRNIDARAFFTQWSLVLLATVAAGGYFSRQASPDRVRLAAACLAPGLFAGGAVSGCLTLTSGLPLFPAIFWVVFYGLALLSTRAVAGSAVLALGWAFLLTGVGAFIYLLNLTIEPEFDLPTPTNLYPAALMGATFGGYHLIYAACTWPRRRGAL